jgi:hypothetical protein
MKTPPTTAAIFLAMHSSWNEAKLFRHEAGQVADHPYYSDDKCRPKFRPPPHHERPRRLVKALAA